MRWERTPDGDWLHRPWWKVAINTVLRAIQPRTRAYLIYTKCDDDTEPPTVLGYGFGLIKMKEIR